MICSYANVELLRISFRTRNEDILPWHGNSYGLQKEFQVYRFVRISWRPNGHTTKFYNKRLEKQAEHSGKPSFLQFLNRLFQVQITANIICYQQLELGMR
jgi:hypothetical protein